MYLLFACVQWEVSSGEVYVAREFLQGRGKRELYHQRICGTLNLNPVTLSTK